VRGLICRKREVNTMAKITKDIFGSGFTVKKDNGSTEHFTRQTFGTGYSGNKGTKIRENNLSGGYTTNTGKKIYRDMLGGGYHTSDGKKIQKNLIGSGYTITNGCLIPIITTLCIIGVLAAMLFA
jgi:hypothetical protein